MLTLVEWSAVTASQWSTKIEEAGKRLAGISWRTPLESSERLSSEFGADVWLKREDLQLTRSYKIRGAYNFIAALSDDERQRGVVAASAGNHAQGVAYACQQLSVAGTIFVPHTTPRQKIQRITAIGEPWITIVTTGHNFDDAQEAARESITASGGVLVPPFDHPEVIAGQATLGVEILEQLGRSPDVVIAAVGGGGLIAGQALVAATAKPAYRVIGVEPAGAASMSEALKAGKPVFLDVVDTFVDGAAVRRVGDATFPIVRDLVESVITVSEGAVCSAMLELYQCEGIVAEPAGALAVAALRDLTDVVRDKSVVCIVSGGNNDVSRYGEIIERSLVHEGMKHYFLIEFPQEPGALRRFLDEVLGPTDDIALFEYVKKNNREIGPALVGIELASPADLEPLQERMANSPLRIEPVPPGSPLFAFLL